MVKDVYLYRHAQAEHNATMNWSLHDPALTLLGVSQARDIPTTFTEQFPDAMVPTPLLVSSPLRRTIQTSLLGFPSLGKPLLLPELQECNNLPCDTGSKADVLKELFPDMDFSGLPKDWPSKKGRWNPTPKSLAERARIARLWIRNRPEETVIVVTHGDFLRYYLAAGADGKEEEHWENAAGRLYRFVDGPDSKDEHAWLVRVRNDSAVPEKAQIHSKTSGDMAYEAKA